MKEIDTSDRLLTALESASLLALPESSFWAISADAAAGLPRPIKIGRRSRWSRRALEQWIREQHAAAQK